jgi:hypothetical protein
MKETGFVEDAWLPRTHGIRQVRAQESPLNCRMLVPTEGFLHSETVMRMAGHGQEKSGRKRNRA